MTQLTPTPQQALAALLEHCAPRRLLCVGQHPLPAVTAYCQSHDCHLDQVSGVPLPEPVARQRYDMAIVADCLEHLPKNTGLQLLGSLRNLNASRLAALVDMQAAGWQITDVYALALRIDQRFVRGEQTLSLLTYDLQDYKPVPDWLNARFWAHPELFGKFWW